MLHRSALTHTETMRIEPLGDSAAIVRDLGQPAYELAERINAALPNGVFEAVASYDTLGLYFDSSLLGVEGLKSKVEEIAAENPKSKIQNPKSHLIPVCYDHAEDMEFVCERTGLNAAEVIEAHTSIRYRCYAIGFCPGFPYLGYLPDQLAGLPRKNQPRVRVTPGSVGMTGSQTGVYPLPRPGGWQLIGRTPLTLVDPDADYFPIVAGDEVQFEPISSAQFDRLEGKRL